MVNPDFYSYPDPDPVPVDADKVRNIRRAIDNWTTVCQRIPSTNVDFGPHNVFVGRLCINAIGASEKLSGGPVTNAFVTDLVELFMEVFQTMQSDIRNAGRLITGAWN